ncbi:30S ribosome-binding factor RbfA [Niameybacter massiliensis]|uniref:Ribosome-binding factor A n=1 Tax=Holtiella tumoricola TaxID=3018743 RepID=A0AA42J1X8_9FIRM|nr:MULTISPECIES: 30S ribosome-binding factor RbfA [Lachnospirales]MDA3732631.1 30S ribosome-binding factor RbfA [Holtiella tumoricola]
MASQRIIKINEEIRKELSEIVRSEIKDPRVSGAMVSVMDVETTNDLKFAKVFISVLQEDKKEEAIAGLNAAGGFLRKEIARRINLRNTPQLIFKLDETIAYGMKMSKMIDDAIKGHN